MYKIMKLSFIRTGQSDIETTCHELLEVGGERQVLKKKDEHEKTIVIITF